MRGLFAVTRGWARQARARHASPLQPTRRGRARPARRMFTVLTLLVVSAGGQIRYTANASLVIVDVTVKDKSGKAIDSLSQNDFTVSEDGKQQKISVFEVQKLAMEPAPPPPPPTLADVNAIPEPPKTTITTETPGQVQYHDKRLMVMFFDFSSMGIPEQLRAQEAALKFIDTQMSVADAADTATDDEEDTGAAFVADETELNIYNTDRKLAAFEDAAKKLSALPEKKALIYFAGGVARTGGDNQAQLEASINAATKANVAIYPIDARGLMADPPGGGAS